MVHQPHGGLARLWQCRPERGWRAGRWCEGGGAGRTRQTASCDARVACGAARGRRVACRTGGASTLAPAGPVEAPSIGRDAHLLQGLRPEAAGRRQHALSHRSSPQQRLRDHERLRRGAGRTRETEPTQAGGGGPGGPRQAAGDRRGGRRARLVGPCCVLRRIYAVCTARAALRIVLAIDDRAAASGGLPTGRPIAAGPSNSTLGRCCGPQGSTQRSRGGARTSQSRQQRRSGSPTRRRSRRRRRQAGAAQ